MNISFLISSHNRANLLRRTLHSIQRVFKDIEFEVVLADDGSTDDIQCLLQSFSFRSLLVHVDVEEFTKKTGISQYFNNPSLTNNIAFKYSIGDHVCLVGNDIIFYKANNLDRYLNDTMVFPTTYDMGESLTDGLNVNGDNLPENAIRKVARWPLQSSQYRSDVTNYGSFCPRETWNAIGGYDERYVGGISSDDSDFVRRARKYGTKTIIAPDIVTFHQYHGGKTAYYEPKQDIISKQRWDIGVKHNHNIFYAYKHEDDHTNPQGFPWGSYGVKKVEVYG